MAMPITRKSDYQPQVGPQVATPMSQDTVLVDVELLATLANLAVRSNFGAYRDDIVLRLQRARDLPHFLNIMKQGVHMADLQHYLENRGADENAAFHEQTSFEP